MIKAPETVTELPVFKQVSGHHHPAPFLLTKDMFGGIPVEMAGAEITHLVDRPVAEHHVHDVDEIYILVSPNPKGATIEIECGQDRIVAQSPAAVFIPAGLTHRFVTRAAEPGSFCFGLFLPHGDAFA
jgi:mannose-6-phosphate isomerase-like protein (cupin superfamily)